MSTSEPIYLTEVESARIVADAAIGALADHREAMDPTWPGDLILERKLYKIARRSELRARQMEFQSHADQAIDLTGGQR